MLAASTSPAGTASGGLSPDYWRQRTHLVDMGLMFGNGALKVAILVPLFGSHILATVWVARCLQSWLGDAPALELPWLMIALSYTLVFFLLEDFSRFALHFCMHRIPWLWRLHSLHHSANRLSPLTLFRVHPIEMMLYYLRGMAVFGLVSGSFVYLFGARLSGIDILGVDALGFMFNLIGANLRHSHIWLSFGWLERFFISPAQHQLHHSSAPEHRDRNLGTCLALWDRSMNTWLAAGPARKLTFGLTVPAYQPTTPTTAPTIQGTAPAAG